MKKNSIKLIITNTEQYKRPMEEVSKSIMDIVAKRMMCTVESEPIDISQTSEIGYHGSVLEVDANITTRKDDIWGAIYAIHFHESLGLDGFYERQLVASIINRCRKIIAKIKKEKGNGLGFYKSMDESWAEFSAKQLANFENPNHAIHKKATRPQLQHNPGLVYKTFRPLTIQLLPSRTVVIDVYETVMEDESKAITLSLFVTSEKMVEAPSITIAKEQE